MALIVKTNKDHHYSWYAYMIIEVEDILPVYGWNNYVLAEALYIMSLIPLSIGWRQGI